VISDWIKVRITSQQGSTFLDRMIALVEGAERQKTPNEIALQHLLGRLSIIFVFSVATSRALPPMPAARSVLVLVALFVTLIPTTNRRLAVGDRHRRHGPAVRFNVLAWSGRAVEAAATSTRCCSTDRHHHARQRQATEFPPGRGRRSARPGRRRPARLAVR